MTNKEKRLLLIDLCARLPYGVLGVHLIGNKVHNTCSRLTGLLFDSLLNSAVDTFKPYLRPMSSMTEEERNELSARYVWKIIGGKIQIRYHSEGYWDNDTECPTEEYLKLFDWLNAHHFDYRGLIPMGLALEAKEGMYKWNKYD